MCSDWSNEAREVLNAWLLNDVKRLKRARQKTVLALEDKSPLKHSEKEVVEAQAREDEIIETQRKANDIFETQPKEDETLSSRTRSVICGQGSATSVRHSERRTRSLRRSQTEIPQQYHPLRFYHLRLLAHHHQHHHHHRQHHHLRLTVASAMMRRTTELEAALTHLE